MRRSFIVLVALIAPALHAATVRGRVVAQDGSVLPGVSVALGSASTLSDVQGRFEFADVADGEANLVAFLSGYGVTRVRVTVSGSLQTDDLVLRPGFTEDCGAAPDSPWQPPSCHDESFDALLIEAAKQNDPSALDLLEQRFDLAISYRERYVIGRELLAHRRYVDRVWEAVKDDAEMAVRFAGVEHWADLDDWCRDHEIDSAAYWLTIQAAWRLAQSDVRARPLLLKALENNVLLAPAISALARLHDESALPDIDRALEHSPWRDWSALALAEFHSDAADAIAAKYLSWELQSAYRDARNADPEP